MSNNKDLEKIKKMTADLTEEYKPGTIGQQAGGIIIACAERMAKDVEDARKMSLNWQNRYTNILIEKNKVEEELRIQLKAAMKERDYKAKIVDLETCLLCPDADKSEIARLKAELAAAKENELKALHEMGRLKAELARRPEVVRCGECEFCQEDSLNHKFCDKAAFPREVFYDDFCSLGQRRESEVQ